MHPGVLLQLRNSTAPDLWEWDTDEPSAVSRERWGPCLLAAPSGALQAQSSEQNIYRERISINHFKHLLI